MKRSLAAAILTGAVALVPLAGHASTGNGLSCTISSATASFDNAVGALDQIIANNAGSITGNMVCYHATATDQGAADGVFRAGDFDMELTGGTSCAVNSLAGTFTATFVTDSGRDLWSGIADDAGGLVQVAHITVNSIEHQTQDVNGDWVTQSQDNVGANLVVGTIQENLADPTVCAPGGAGFTSTDVAGQFKGAFESHAEV